jgi:hypothetical protein
VTLVRPFLNTVIHSYKFFCSKALVSILCWESGNGFLSLVHLQPTATVSLDAALLWYILKAEWPCKLCYDNTATAWWRSKVFHYHIWKSVLLPAHKITSAATTRWFKINKCRNFLTHLHTSISRAPFCIAWISHNKLHNKDIAWGWW